MEQIVGAVENAVKAELPSFLAACLVNISQPYNIAHVMLKPAEEAVTEANSEDIDYDFISGAGCDTAYEKAIHKPKAFGTEFLRKDERYHLRRKAELTIYQ